ncbi:ankyrin repeat domain-containing protein [Jiangella sp. DSM 45060]|uniref:ankyrin repeat domain-containing protein n=1 Tax=Jiangella sp. DSM 45060 TaxID=1798224 RepID=UPI00087DD76A|nr:ankyrin repeat domain-containing protein [Jiangella sp. DSM 45060]SDS41252.1 Ankyrin repeat-containing protein [Jiangella sp. DSM 45060]
MPELPARPDLGHLKKQAKELLRGYHDGDPAAAARFRATLPHATGPHTTAPRLRDAQSCVAREYGFASWAALRRHVEEVRGVTAEHWLRLVYAGDTIGGTHAARPVEAARLLRAVREGAGTAAAAGGIATATGDIAAVEAAIAADPGWVHRSGGTLRLPPLLAVAHSSLVRLPEFAGGLRACSRALLAAGADPNQAVVPAGGQHPVTALYGAAGVTHDHELTTLLLDAGADPDDGESLYHSLGDRECARLLLAAGATVTGTNAMYAAADHDDAGVLRLLLEHGGDADEPSPSWGTPLLFALRRRCSTHYVRLLLDAGADPRAVTPDGVGAHRLALRFGLTEAAALLPADDADGTPLDDLITACASGDGAAARNLLAAHPGLVDTLDDGRRRLLPDLAGEGAADAVRLLVEAGWPIDHPGGDWNATALNHAVFRGDAALARFLLEHGADPAVVHGFGDTVVGTLAWASRNNEEPGIAGDWAGCAQALLDHGVELPELS